MLLEGLTDFFHVDLGLGIAALHQLQLIALLLEKAQEALFLLLIQSLQLSHHADDQVANLSQVLGADICQGGIGEIGHLFLGACPVLQNLGGIFQIDLRGKVTDHLLLGGGQHRLGNGRLLLHGQGLRLGGGFQLRLQGQAGDGGIHIFKIHMGSPLR